MHCSFKYRNFVYVIGGYAYSTQLSFVSRLSLATLSWEHQLDRKVSTVVNRSNRRFFSNINFRQIKMELPMNRYAHSCTLDAKNDLVYMFGGVKYDNENYAQFSFKETTNELWSLNLLTNKWSLLNEGENSASTGSRTTSSSTQGRNSAAAGIKHYTLPVAVSGHSMHLIRNLQDNFTLINIFFGYSEYYGANLNLIQEYNVGKNYLIFIFRTTRNA